MPIIRINKYLADSGVSSRRKSEEYISQGRVAVNDIIIIDFSQKVNTEKDVVTLDGEKIKLKKHIYILLNKPKGYITTVSDDRSRQTVLDLVKVKERIYPVGRLDYDTAGLLFLTNDGEFSQLLTHPGNKVPREYEVRLDKPLEEEDKIKLLQGIRLEGKLGKFLKLTYPEQKNKKNVIIYCEEGRNRFVKRMFGRLEYTVVELNRVSFAGIYLDTPPGKSRKLTLQEVQLIKNKYSH
ncbi:MAG: rRNA pseudouridine synthase [Ignavibacteriaceae bacterium]|jgi:23S rRNA pseudouridine2605 synthase|nr:rRNA pseudouridine synthase [Ignavibacteriaceae bacterium]